jgi:hypothetical protein
VMAMVMATVMVMVIMPIAARITTTPIASVPATPALVLGSHSATAEAGARSSRHPTEIPSAATEMRSAATGTPSAATTKRNGRGRQNGSAANYTKYTF